MEMGEGRGGNGGGGPYYLKHQMVGPDDSAGRVLP